MNDDRTAYMIGIGATTVGRQPERGFDDLAGEALDLAFADAGIDDRERVDHVAFSSVLMDFWGQRASRGQEALAPLVAAGRFPAGTTILNVEGGCASASVAFHGAWKHVLSGQGEVALAVGVEKMNHATRPRDEILAWIEGAAGVLDADAYYQPYHQLAAELGTSFTPGPGRSVAMDVYALWAKSHMAAYGTTVGHIAAAAAKNHTNAVGNPRAQYRFEMSVDEVLADRVVADPLTRAMCAPAGDAAGAALVCSEAFLAGLPERARSRALRIAGHALTGGKVGVSWDGDRAPVRAVAAVYAMAGIGPEDLDVIELHDAASFAEIHLVEDLELCPRGQGGPFTASGASSRDGDTPVNPSGGLVSRGHPIGATGILMLNEIALQLRGEAGEIQVPEARVGLAENGGGIIGHDSAVCSVTVLEAAA